MHFLSVAFRVLIHICALVLLTVGGIFFHSTSAPTRIHPQPQTFTSNAASATSSTSPKMSSKTASTTTITISHSHASSSTHATSPTPSPPTPLSYTLTYLPNETVNTTLKESVVNILCTTQAGGSLQPISGSGVIVTKSGIVLTNAHVAQFFLLRDYVRPNSVDCIIRTGSPAVPQYRAILLYLPPAWISANASEIDKSESVGSGEDDYAFLLMTGPLYGSAPLPTFASPLLTLDDPIADDPVVIVSYPAQFLGGTSIISNLYSSSAVSTVQKLYTFKDKNVVDAVSLGSPINAQAGSSGGGVARLEDGALEAIVATATVGNSTSNRELRAITLAHIDRSLAKYGEGSLASLLTSGDLSQKAADFNRNIAPSLTKQLEDALK